MEDEKVDRPSNQKSSEGKLTAIEEVFELWQSQDLQKDALDSQRTSSSGIPSLELVGAVPQRAEDRTAKATSRNESAATGDRTVSATAASQVTRLEGREPDSPAAGVQEAPKVGDSVYFKGEALRVGAIVDGKALVYEPGRNSDHALIPTRVNDQQLKADFKDVKVNINGRETTRYIDNSAKQVFQLVEVGGQKALYPDYSFEVANLSDLSTAPGKGGKAKGSVEGASQSAGEKNDRQETLSESAKTASSPAPELPPVGAEVKYKGEKLSVAGFSGNHTLLQKPGRNADYAVMARTVSDAELNAKYDTVKVSIDGKDTTRYMEKGHPEQGVFIGSKIQGQTMIFQDHSFEVVKNSVLADRNTAADRSQRGTNKTTGTPKDSKTDSGSGDKVPGEAQDKAQDKQDKNKSSEKALSGSDKTAGDSALHEVAKQDGVMRDGRPAVERVASIDGKEVKTRTPKADGASRNYREVEISGKKIELTLGYPQIWFYSKTGAGPAIDPAKEQVKLHVTGVDSKDLARLQANLLPTLENMLDKGDVHQYKTFDPNFLDSKWSTDPAMYGVPPGPEGQQSKAFTVYVSPEKAQDVAKVIDKQLKEAGLTLSNFEGDNVAELTRKQSDSKRVSVERDMWVLTEDAHGRNGALIDEKVSKQLHEKFKDKLGPDGRWKPEALLDVEKAAGIAANQLAYDRNGDLMFKDANYESKRQDRHRFYASEHRAQKEVGHKTGRPALYALYDLVSADPARVFTDKVASSASSNPNPGKPAMAREREIPKPEKLEGTDTRVKEDGTYERRDVRPGEVLAREQLEQRHRVDAKEIESIKNRAAELSKSTSADEREQAKALERTADALAGKAGVEAELIAHREVLKESRELLKRGEGGGYGKAVSGGLIAVAILTGAALSYYRSQQRAQTPKGREKAKVR